MRALIGIDVAPDGSGAFEVSMAFDEEMRALIEEESPEPIDWSDPSTFDDADTSLIDDLPEGSTIAPYSEDGFEGFTVSAEFADLDELDRILAGGEEDEALPIRITSDGERFHLVSDGPIFEEADLGEDAELLPESVMSELFDMQLRVRLPGEIVSTNADETTPEGVMVWQLDPAAQEPVEPEAISEAGGGLPLVAILVVAAVVVVAAVAAIYLVGRRNGSGAVDEPVVTEESPPSE